MHSVKKFVRKANELALRYLDEGFIESRFFLVRNGWKIWTRPLSSKAVSLPARQGKVVVVGTGVGALSLCRTLRDRGFSEITIVSRNGDYGGTCVRRGCMPLEFFWANRSLSGLAYVDKLRQFISRLSDSTKVQFENLGRLVDSEVLEIQGNSAHVRSGEPIKFDYLFLATGSRPRDESKFDTIGVDDMWALSNRTVVLVSDHNLGVFSAADVLRANGCRVTVVLTKLPQLHELRSFQAFVTDIRARGITVFENATVISVERNVAVVSNNSDYTSLAFDDFLSFGSRVPFLPNIDGRRVGVESIDFRTSKVNGRDNIYAVGDAAGFLSASEAEFHGKLLGDSFISGRPISSFNFGRMPISIHAERTFAMVGAAASYLSDQWFEIDFGALGWSAVHSEKGKLWYHFDHKLLKVDAIHVLHPRAAEIVSYGAILMEKAITDRAWYSFTTHPSYLEVFKLIANDVSQRRFVPSWDIVNDRVDQNDSFYFRIPSVLTSSRKSLLCFVRPRQISTAILDQDPVAHLGVFIALRNLMTLGELPLFTDDQIHIERSGTQSLIAKMGEQIYEIDYLFKTEFMQITLLNKRVTVEFFDGVLGN